MDNPFDPPLRSEQTFLFLDVPLVDAPAVQQVRIFVLRQSSDSKAVLRELAEVSLFE